MKKTIICVILAALTLSAFGCKKQDEPDTPGYVPPDLSYPTNDNIDTDETDHDLPFDTNPVTDYAVTEPAVITPPATDPPATEPPVTTPTPTEPVVTEPATTDPPSTDEPSASEPPATEPEATDDGYVVPDVIIVPTEIPYVILSADGYYEFVKRPDSGYFDKGINIYYTVSGEEGVIHMNKVDNYGFEKYIGVHQSGPYDLEKDLINVILSGEVQDALVDKRLDPQINEIGAIGYIGDLPNFIWISTSEDDYIVIMADGTDGANYCIYTVSDYREMLGLDK